MVNSLTRRPFDQSASTRKLRNGSLTAPLVVTNMVALPSSALFITEKRSSDKLSGRDKPALAKESLDARLTSKSSISLGRAETTSISALSG